jgi:pimeloyl-ACP methyl ester carboxylesterase
MSATRVFDGEHLRATLLPGERDHLVVTLDYRRTGKSDFTPDIHSSTFARKGYAQLSIKTRTNDWFVNADTTALEAGLADIAARYGKVTLLGYSMGGYGALRFARALGAASAVIISPQVSIAPDVVPFDPRYRAEGRRFDKVTGDLTPHAMPGLSGLIVIDPFVAADLRHARMIRALFPGLSFVRLGFGGHPAIRVLRGAGKAWTIHREAVMDSPKGTFMCREHRAGRRASAGYWTRLAARTLTQRPALAAYAQAMADTLTPKSGDGPEDKDDGA